MKICVKKSLLFIIAVNMVPVATIQAGNKKPVYTVLGLVAAAGVGYVAYNKYYLPSQNNSSATVTNELQQELEQKRLEQETLDQNKKDYALAQEKHNKKQEELWQQERKASEAAAADLQAEKILQQKQDKEAKQKKQEVILETVRPQDGVSYNQRVMSERLNEKIKKQEKAAQDEINKKMEPQQEKAQQKINPSITESLATIIGYIKPLIPTRTATESDSNDPKDRFECMLNQIQAYEEDYY